MTDKEILINYLGISAEEADKWIEGLAKKPRIDDLKLELLAAIPHGTMIRAQGGPISGTYQNPKPLPEKPQNVVEITDE